MMNDRKAKRYTVFLILITFILRLLSISINGLSTGEAYYSRGIASLDWSYFDQPPLFVWLSWLSTQLLGLSSFAIRLPAVLLFCGTTWLMFLIGKRLFSAQAGFYAALTLNVSAVFALSVANWYQPDAPLMFFWMLCTWCIVQLFFPKEGQQVNQKYIYKWWLLAGVTMGLTSLSKYHVVFLLVGVFLFVLTRKKFRHWIAHPGPYLALFINFLMMFPVLWWNYKNNWVSFLWQSGRAGSGGEFSLHFDWFFTSIGGQFLWLSPWIFIPLIIQLPRAYKRGKVEDNYWFVFWTAVLPIVFFTIITLWSDLGFHFHWQAPGYMMLFLVLGESIKDAFEQGKRKKLTKRWLYLSAFFMLFVATVLSTHTATGFWKPYGPKWFAGLFGNQDDPTMEMYDYDDLRYRLKEMGVYEDDKYFVGCTRWWICGKVDWALRLKKEVLCFNMYPRNYAFYFDPKASLGKNAIIVGKDDEGVNHIKPYFEEFEQMEDVSIMRGGVEEFTLQLYHAKGFKLSKREHPGMPLDVQLRRGDDEEFIYHVND